MASMSDVESRRSSRVAARFWVAIEGVDAEMVPRRGDLSATGIFFEISSAVTEVGDVGTVQWLHIASHDRTRRLDIMAHVVRVASLADLHRKVSGIAFEFMPESDDAAAAVCDFVHYVLERPEADGPTPFIAPRVEARAASGTAASSPATVHQLSVRTLLLETDWAVPVGAPIRVEIIARGVRRPVRLEGETVSVLPAVSPDPVKRYRIAVRMNEEITGPLRRFSSHQIHAADVEALVAKAEQDPERPLDKLLADLIQPPAVPPQRGHLSGVLSRIPFGSLCSLLELERLTGELRICRTDGKQTTLYVREGRFVDLIGPSADTHPRAELAALLASRDGKFELVVAPVEREDRIGMSMAQLLISTAQAVDEDVPH
jgi:hypothetical protein